MSFTDVEIIKALECCASGKCVGEECPFHKEQDACITLISQHALGIIKQQREELSDIRTKFNKAYYGRLAIERKLEALLFDIMKGD